MGMKSAEETKALVLKAFDTLFNKRDYAKATGLWSENYIQHSAHIAPGRDGLFNLIRSLPDTLRYENALILAEGDYVMLHGRFSNIGQAADWLQTTDRRSGGQDPAITQMKKYWNFSDQAPLPVPPPVQPHAAVSPQLAGPATQPAVAK